MSVGWTEDPSREQNKWVMRLGVQWILEEGPRLLLHVTRKYKVFSSLRLSRTPTCHKCGVVQYDGAPGDD